MKQNCGAIPLARGNGRTDRHPNEKRVAQEKYIKACKLAAEAHKCQLVPATELPYSVHLSLVSVEVIAAIGADDRYDADLAAAYIK